jgi:fructose-bisphosphate aldolase class I
MPMSSCTTLLGLSLERREELARNAEAIVANGKGILAADESIGTAGKRLASIGLDNTEENRRKYRELLFSSAKDLKEYLGGVILFEETVDQETLDGTRFVQLLTDAGIVPGIKLDKVRYLPPCHTLCREQ